MMNRHESMSSPPEDWSDIQPSHRPQVDESRRNRWRGDPSASSPPPLSPTPAQEHLKRGRSATPRRRVEEEDDNYPPRSLEPGIRHGIARPSNTTTRNRSPSPTLVLGVRGLTYYDEENLSKNNEFQHNDDHEAFSHSEETVEVGMSLFTDLKCIRSWNLKFIWVQMLIGMTMAINQVPECVSYALIAGVDPFHALQAAWITNIFTSVVGGSPGLVSGPSGLGAIAVRFLVSAHGLEYMFYAVILCGICHVLFSALKLGKYLRVLPTGITIGMINALCVLLTLLQLRYFKIYPTSYQPAVETSTYDEPSSTEIGNNTYVEPTRGLESTSSTSITNTENSFNQPWAYFLGYDIPWANSASGLLVILFEALVAMLICHFIPRYIQTVPSSLLAIISLTGMDAILRLNRPEMMTSTVGDYFSWEAPKSNLFMGMFHSDYSIPPLNIETIIAVVPGGISLFCISLLETMVAINVVDKYTSVIAEQDQVFFGQGVGNLVSGLMAGMGGTGLAHTSLHGVRVGGVTTFSVFFAGVTMMCILTYVYPAVALIPLGAFMGTSLYLVLTMLQVSPVLGLAINCVPCLQRFPSLMSKKLVVADLFSSLVTSILVIFASTYCLVGYLIGVVCYACDQIAHAAILDEGVSQINFMELKLHQALPMIR